jgi:hypothetical protein
VSESQAADLTLNVDAGLTRAPIQVWIRTAGRIDSSGRIVTSYLSTADASSVKAGQRARTFPVESRSSMFQAFVSRVGAEGNRVRVRRDVDAKGREHSTNYVVEIVTDRGDFLSIPNEAIIEEGDRRIAYVQRGGQFEPQEIRTGLQGELYTQIAGRSRGGRRGRHVRQLLHRLEYKLKGAARGRP